MIRTNLSTRPFYNERAVQLLLGLAALIVVAITVWNVVRIVALSRHNTELTTQTGREHEEAERLTAEAAAIRRSLDREQLESVVEAASEANALIDQRTFSWTRFFNVIESELPPDVMLTSVTPSFREAQTRVTMNVMARRTEDVDEFMEKLEASGAFESVIPSREDTTEQGLKRVTITSVYTGDAVAAEPESAPPAEAPTPAAPPSRRGARP